MKIFFIWNDEWFSLLNKVFDFYPERIADFLLRLSHPFANLESAHIGSVVKFKRHYYWFTYSGCNV